MKPKRRQAEGAGAIPQIAKREHYLDLMNQGINNSEACREVGINRKTGTRWRYGRVYTNTSAGTTTFYPPVTPTSEPEPISDRYLSSEDRLVIADGIKAGKTQRSIADHVGCHPSTISRELYRNRDPITGAYTPHRAHKSAHDRRTRPKPRLLDTNTELREAVQTGLEQKWSPEQISHRLLVDYPTRTEMRIAPETIYQTLYDPEADCLDRTLTKRLRTGRTIRRPRRQGDKRRTRGFIDPSVMLDQRPPEADGREVVGHWEGDLIVGSFNRSAIGTLVERVTRFTILVHVDGRHTADDLRDSLIDVFNGLPEELKKSLTWDQGVEMARHRCFTQDSGVPVFFCERSSPWQRGTNENTNGLLRQYFPKHTDLGIYDRDHLGRVASELNSRPRKLLGWDSPAERLDKVAC